MTTRRAPARPACCWRPSTSAPRGLGTALLARHRPTGTVVLRGAASRSCRYCATPGAADQPPELLPLRPVRLPLVSIDPASVYRHRERRYSGSHLTAVGLPVQWTAEHDAELVVLRRA
nr:GH36 C-terminal domain-containing protein [Streptomyces sp. NBC_00830]